MAQLTVISAGAAQSVVAQVAEAMRGGDGDLVSATFGAVGAQKARLLSGEPADVVVLTRTLIEELARQGHVVEGSRADLGGVGLGVAVRRGDERPDIATIEGFRASLRDARAISFPDPQLATAGIHLMAVLERLGLRGELAERLRPFPNGNAAMTALARGEEPGQLGITMITEIKLVGGVELVAPLPPPIQSTTIYSAGVATRAAHPDRAHEFVARLAGPGARSMLVAAGFEL
jgi:molybdate transport system substrate-binding protein